MSKSFGSLFAEMSSPWRLAIPFLILCLVLGVPSFMMLTGTGGTEHGFRIDSILVLAAFGISLAVAVAIAVIGFAQGSGLKSARSDSKYAETGAIDATESLEHELRTLLTAAVSLSDLLLETRLEKEQKQYAGALTDALRSAFYLVDSKLSPTNSSDVVADIGSIVFSPRDVIRNVQTLFVADARRRKVEIAVDVADDIPTAIYGDGNKVRQVLVNLVSNALKHSDSRSIQISCRHDTLHSNRGDGLLRVAVRDLGRGIPAAEQERLFRNVRRTRRAAKGRPGVSGLGLLICRDFVFSMGGAIGVNSHVGGGSCFWFTIPARNAGRHATAERFALTTGGRGMNVTTDNQSTTESAKVCRVLVVEDHEVIAMVSRRILESAGHEVIVVDDARAAVEICAQETFSIILMDHRLRYGCGLEAARGIRECERERGARSRLVLVTAAEIDERFRAAAYAAGVDDILQKPISSAVLKSLVNSDVPVDSVGMRSAAEAATTDPDLISELARIDGGNGQSLLEVLLEKTAAGMPGWCSAIESAAESGDTRSVRRLAHRMLGICRQLGAPRMASVCERLAALGLAGPGNLTGVPELTEMLDREFENFRAEVQCKAQRHLYLSKSVKPDRMEGHF